MRWSGAAPCTSKGKNSVFEEHQVNITGSEKLELEKSPKPGTLTKVFTALLPLD